MSQWRVVLGDARTVLAGLAPGSVQTCVTSPPYFGLRDYGTAQWEGGDPVCDHAESYQHVSTKSTLYSPGESIPGAAAIKHGKQIGKQFTTNCGKCGATRIDSQIGLEPTPDAYVAELVNVFREVRRVLRDDGTLWLNLGDSYAGGGGFSINAPSTGTSKSGKYGAIGALKSGGIDPKSAGCKPKDLIGIPWRVAFALQQPYTDWAIRSEADRAWLAGLVDGEGSLTILETESPHGSGNSYPPILQIRMCDIECIAKSAAITGMGKASPRQDPPSQGGTRGSYQWRLNGSKAARVVADIYPHLLIKRKQAIVLWNHQLVRESYDTKKGQPIPRAAVEKQQMCRELIRALNRREAVDIPSWMVEPTVATEPGWYLRSDVIWHKPNPMPESVTDRPTKSHEYLFLLTKAARYYYDAEAIKEDAVCTPRPETSRNGDNAKSRDERGTGVSARTTLGFNQPENGRNKRSVWTVATQPYPDAHFATYPEALIEPCILAGTSERGQCPGCGGPWVRVVEREPKPAGRSEGEVYTAKAYGPNPHSVVWGSGKKLGGDPRPSTTTGWQPSCSCGGDPIPQTVLDPFTGSGTTGAVAIRHQRSFVGVELNPEYLQLARARIGDVAPLFAEEVA